MKILSQIFGNAKAEIVPAIEPDQQCPTCRAYLEHSQVRVNYGGRTFCRKECIPPSLIASVEAEARSAKLQADNAKRQSEVDRKAAQHAALESAWAKLHDPATQQLLREVGIDPAPRIKQLHRQLFPHSRRYLKPGETAFLEIVQGGHAVLIQPTD